jgi:predicted metal-dependent hydrolase
MTRLIASYGSRKIEFDLERRSVRSLTITVKPDGKVRVVAPLLAEESRVVARVAKRGRWIVRQWERQSVWLPVRPPLVHQSGESVRYLGRQYRLRILIDHAVTGMTVAFNRSVIEVKAGRRLTRGEIGNAISKWLRKRAGDVLPVRFAKCCKVAELHGLTCGRLSLRSMPKRWGSCLKNGPILLNPDLIRASVDCIDYVILHEMCHRKFHSHGPAFYRLLSAVAPDWRRVRAKLAMSSS